MNPTVVRRDVSPQMFHEEIRPVAEPVVMRGLVAGWPAVTAARESAVACVRYFSDMATSKPVHHVRAAPEAEGRLHYRDDVQALNFERSASPLADFLAALLAEGGKPRPDAVAVQGLTGNHLPGFAEANALDILPPGVLPRLWIGNAAKVATHNDPSENVACVVAGHRRFTLFAPDQVGNLYMGPFHNTPAGTQVSMVHLTDPDLARYPRFATALDAALTAELEPGDAIYIPYQWYHHVEALDRFNVLVNFWWDPARTDIGSPWDAMMLGMMTLRNLPPDQRAAWRAMFDQYVFLANGDPGAHLPPPARGVLAATSPADVAQMRRGLINTLQQAAARR